jgi:hypothetical protein
VSRFIPPPLAGEVENGLSHPVWISHHLHRPIAHHPDTFTQQISIASNVAGRLVAHIVALSIDFDRQLGLGAIEIQNVGTKRVLASKPWLAITQPNP